MIKRHVLHLPEYLLLGAVFFYWVSAGIAMNPIAIVLTIALILQIIFKNRIVGIALPSLLVLASLYMLLALISELNEFETFNAEARKLLLVGASFFVSTILVSGLMLYRYLGMYNEGLVHAGIQEADGK